MNDQTLVLGIGNNLLGDEGVGIHVIEHLRSRLNVIPAPLADKLALVDGGTLSFTLAGIIADYQQLIIIDATRLDAPPGTIKVFENEDMDRFLGTGKHKSVHEVSLLDLMAVLALGDQLPSRRVLIGIQPQTVDWSSTLSLAVESCIPKVCETIIKLADQDINNNPNNTKSKANIDHGEPATL